MLSKDKEFDFLLSILHVRSIGESITMAILSLVTFLITYFKGVVFDNSNMFMSIFLVLTADWIFGTIKGVKEEGFVTWKALKFVWYYASYSLFLLLGISIEKAFPGVFFMAEVLMIPIITFTLISAVKNASLAGFLPKALQLQILDKIDGYKNVNTSIPSDKDEYKDTGEGLMEKQ